MSTKAQRQTHRFLRFILTHNGDDGHEDFHYIDLAQQLSLINRRLYRQGMVYHVANITVHDGDGDAFVKFCTAPNTYITHKAWATGFRNWKKQRAMVLQGMDQSLVPRSLTGAWSDFKVYLNADHIDDVDKPTFSDIENTNISTAGDWDYSKFYQDYDANGVQDEMYIHLMGGHDGTTLDWDSIGLIEALDEIWPTQGQEPVVDSAASTSIYINMFDSGQDEIMDDIENESDDPPYSSSLMPGANASAPYPWEVREVHLGTSANKTGYVGGFPVPCGLLCIETKSSGLGNEIGLLIEMVPGKYKGVMAERMDA